jgi:DNA replication regulator DPB11
VCCTSLDIAERDEIHAYATTLGATKTPFDLTMDVTHLVIGAITSAKYKFVAKSSPNVHVVLPEFVRALREAWMSGEEVDLDQFHEKYKAPVFLGLRISLTGFTDRKRPQSIQNGLVLIICSAISRPSDTANTAKWRRILPRSG